MMCLNLKEFNFTALSGSSVPCGAPISASSSTHCAPPACSGAPASPEMDSPPQGGASEETPPTEVASAADHLPETTEAMEAAESINIILGTAALTKIRSRIETERGDTGTKTTERGDMGGMARAETKTDFMNKDFCPAEEHCFLYKGHSSFRAHRGGHS